MVWGQKTFFSGSKYVGDMSGNGLSIAHTPFNYRVDCVLAPPAGGKRHGKGVKTWQNGDKYEGEWRNDKREGKGVRHCFLSPIDSASHARCTQ